MNTGTTREGSLEVEAGKSVVWGKQKGFCGLQGLGGQGHSLSPQVSDILTPAAPRAPRGHCPLPFSSSPGWVWNQQDKQDQGHRLQARQDLGTEGPRKLRTTCCTAQETVG